MSPTLAAEVDIAFGVVAIVVLVLLMRLIHNIALLITAKAAGAKGVSLSRLLQMRLRRIPVDRVVLPVIAAHKAGVPVTIDILEEHYVAGGNVDRVAVGMIGATRLQAPFTFDEASRMDLSGRDPAAFIKSQVRQGSNPPSTLGADVPLVRSELKS